MQQLFDSHRIVKNTIILYFRMIVITIVSFFTVRITLQILGVEDYGTYNVVAGLVSFLGIITATMSSASQRFLAYDLGKSDINSFNSTFCLLVAVYFAISLFVIIIGELIGPWVIGNYLKIAPNRVTAAQWVFQFSLASFCVSLISSPYQAAIIAYEKMSVFAFVGLFDAIGKLAIALLLYITNHDKMIVYALLLLLITIANFFIQQLYCKIKLPGCNYHVFWDKDSASKLLGYTGWNLFGAASGTLNTAGISLVLNLFFGPLVNAAKAIADRINSIVTSFSLNFYQAIAPQVVKTYAAEDYDKTKLLVYKSSKFSFFLLFIISMPLIYGMPTLLNLWLGEDSVTPDMIIFSRLILIYSLVNIFEQPITMLIRATGNIKKYQINIGIITLSAVPICVCLFLMGMPAYWSILSLIVVYLVAQVARLIIAKKQVGLSLSIYLNSVVFPVLFVAIVTVVAITLPARLLRLNDWWIMVYAFFIGCLTVWCFGLQQKEKSMLINRFLRIR